MTEKSLTIKTDQKLLDALQGSLSVKQSAEDRFEQRVSYVYSSIESDSSVTREHVRKQLSETDC